MTTTLKILQVMTDKGVAVRDEQSRPHRYSPAMPEKKAQARLLNHFVQKAFDGSVRKLLIRAIEEGGLSGEELREVRRLIDNVRKDERGER